MTSTTELRDALSAEYDRQAGFLGQLRGGHYDSDGAERLLAILRALDLEGSEQIDRRLVALLWYLPLFIDWQAERVPELSRSAVPTLGDQSHLGTGANPWCSVRR